MVNTTSIVSGTVTSLEIPVLVQNNGDDAFGARITVTFNSALIFIRVAPAKEVIYCNMFLSEVLFLCSKQLH